MTQEQGNLHEMAALVRQSGCADIQAAIQVADQHGLSLEDLGEPFLLELIDLMASAQAVGGQAAPLTLEE